MPSVERIIEIMASIRNVVSHRDPAPEDCSPADSWPHSPVHFALKIGLASETGPRQKNDDYCAISWKSDFFAISDGIGGAPYGDVMSRIACNAAVEAYDASGDINEAFRFANEEVSTVSRYLGEQSGATLLLAEFDENGLSITYAGDTMAYRLRDGALEPAMSPGRIVGGGNALDNAVGYGETVPDRASVDVRAGDRFIMCTDGVWEYVDEEELVRLISSSSNMPLVADSVCRHAASVGSDNSSCICILVASVDVQDGGSRPYPITPTGFADTPEIDLGPRRPTAQQDCGLE